MTPVASSVKALRSFDGAGVFQAALVVFTVGLVGITTSAAFDPRAALVAWLVAFAYVVTTALGALALLLAVLVMNATWPTLFRRLMEAIAATLPGLALLGLPILMGLALVYPWARPDAAEPALRALLAHKRPWLNPTFFAVRAVICFGVWSTIALLFRKWSLDEDADPSRARHEASLRLAALSLPMFAITLTIEAFDGLMSLTPAWTSTVYGVYVFAGGFVAAIALVALLSWFAERARLLPEVRPSHWYALGRLLFAFTIFWAYIGFFQFMLIWIADRPEEASFFVARTRGAPMRVSVGLVVAHFVVPFVLLLSHRAKRSAGRVASVGAWILAAHYVDVHWLVVPDPRLVGRLFLWADLFALLAAGGFSVALATLLARGRSLFPRHDPRLGRALAYESE
jgi:hypothetical protein